MKPDDFWKLTLAEFGEMVEGFKRQQKRRIDELLYLAWHTAVLSRQKEIPSLSSLLNKNEKKEMTEQEMFEQVKMLNAAFGGEVVYH